MKNLKTVLSPKTGVWHLFVDDFAHESHAPYFTICGMRGPFNARHIGTNRDRFRDAKDATCAKCLKKQEVSA